MITVATRELQNYAGSELWTLVLAKGLSKITDTRIYCNSISSELAKHSKVDIVSNYTDTEWVIANHPTVTNPPLDKSTLVTHSVFLDIERFVPGAASYVAISEELKAIESDYNPQVILNPIDSEEYHPVSVSNSLKTVLYAGWEHSTMLQIKDVVEDAGLNFIYYTPEDKGYSLAHKIHKADLVVGIGRHIIEAMMCGKAVISAGQRSWMSQMIGAGYITPENYKIKQFDNYSGRTSPVITQASQIAQYFDMFDPKHGPQLAELAFEDHNHIKVAQRFYDQIPR
jgi:glycosyltransferase involved in cell wall biosynthesis